MGWNVLAGGMSSRFGEPKALASWQGSTVLLQHIVKVMTNALQGSVVISHSDLKERVRATCTSCCY